MISKSKTQINSIGMVRSIILIGVFGLLNFIILKSNDFSSFTSFIDAFSLALMMFFMSNLIIIIQKYYHAKTPFNTTNIAVVILLTSITFAINYWISYLLHSPIDKDYLQYVNSHWIYRTLLIGLIFMLILFMYWINQQHYQNAKMQEFMLTKERENIQMQLKSLQAQFKPHFLFNSLNSINALTIANPEEARKMIQLLSEFMRGAIKDNKETLIPFEEELHYINLYTDIEKVRFGHRLNIEFNVDEACKSLLLPSFILQPIIENAIKYGLYGSIEDISISIEATCSNNELGVTINNPYDPLSRTSKKGTGYGLKSVEQKLMIIYNQSGLIKTIDKEEQFTTILRIPQL